MTSYCWNGAGEPRCGKWAWLPIVAWLPVQITGQQVGYHFANYETCLCERGFVQRWFNIWGARH